MKIKKVSIIVPIFNEISTLETVFNKLLKLKLTKEVIFVDDGSTDGTKLLLKSLEKKNSPNFKFIYHKKNQGKGKAINTALSEITGDYVIIQDADLEYEPADIINLVKIAERENALVVFGSRNKNIKNKHIYSHYYYGVKILTWFINKLYNQNLSDPETCYKLINTDLLKFVDIDEFGFGVEIEITAKIARLGIKIHETSINYKPRSFKEGKKIKTKDGIWAFYLTLKYKLFDLHYGPLDKYIRNIRLKSALSELRLKKTDKLLDIGCGRQGHLAWDLKSKYAKYLGIDFEVPSVSINNIKFVNGDVHNINNIYSKQYFDKAIGLAIFEHLSNPYMFLQSCFDMLKEGGILILSTPAPAADPILRLLAKFRLIDPSEIEDHKAYYTKEGLESMLKNNGFKKVKVKYFLFGLNTLVIASK